MDSALAGVRVIDFTRQMSGPYGTQVLADFGADVIKVESLTGDGSRRTGTDFINGESALFMMWNRNKRSVALDLHKEESLAVVERLVAEADVLVENYRPGVAEDIGIGYEAMAELNPRLVYCSVSAFGQTGHLAPFPGTDPVVQALSGVMSVTGEPDGEPLLVGVPIADFTGAMLCAQGVLLGLAARERTGRGQRVDVSMLFGLLSTLTTRLATHWATGQDPRRYGNAHSVVVPYQAFATADGWVVAGVWSPEGWPRFCEAIDDPALAEDPRFATNIDRVDHRQELTSLLADRFATRSTDEWEKRFHEHRALFGRICSFSEILSDPQVTEAGMITTVKHPAAGEIRQLAPPVQLSETPGGVRTPPPLLGEHTLEVLSEAGFTAAEIDSLVAAGAIGSTDSTEGAPER